jgi:1-deoxy-D-xylulose 5-phosphate reductoisomerase
MSHSVNTGLSTGSFHTLSVRASNGSMTNILSLISAGSGLSSAEVSALIVAALTSYPSTTAVHTSINSAITTYATSDALQLVAALQPYSTSIQAAALLAAALTPYSTTAQTAVLLAAKENLIVAGASVTKTGSTLSVNDLAALRFKYQNNSAVALSINNTNKLMWNNVRVFDEAETKSLVANGITITGPFGTPTTNTAA